MPKTKLNIQKKRRVAYIAHSIGGCILGFTWKDATAKDNPQLDLEDSNGNLLLRLNARGLAEGRCSWVSAGPKLIKKLKEICG